MEQVRRRPVFAISGWLVLVLLFLPTLRVCGDPTTPIEFPPAYFVYVGSAIAAFGAWSRSRRARHVSFVVLTALWIVAVDLLAVGVISGGNLVIGTIAAVALLSGTIVGIWMLARARTGERPYGSAVVVHAVIATGWYALLTADHDAMWGAYVGLAVTSVMMLAAIGGLARVHAERRAARPAGLPIARMIT